jgi:hypothetical protein
VSAAPGSYYLFSEENANACSVMWERIRRLINWFGLLTVRLEDVAKPGCASYWALVLAKNWLWWVPSTCNVLMYLEKYMDFRCVITLLVIYIRVVYYMKLQHHLFGCLMIIVTTFCFIIYTYIWVFFDVCIWATKYGAKKEQR